MYKYVTISILCALAACAPQRVQKTTIVPVVRLERTGAPDSAGLFPGETQHMRSLVNKYSDHYQVPRELVHKVIQRESDYNPGARNGPYYGLMQILPATARNMGFHGDASQLLNADTNLTYAVKYLRGAWLLSGGDMNRAVMLYARGYYYEARDNCMLVETGLRETEVKKSCRRS